jgi:two-component system chemotaxis response regulator CheB
VTRSIRVLLVDDSSVVRRLLTAAFANHLEIDVVGTAANGILALSKVEQLEPDAIILDVEMPEMDGITMLKKLRETRPKLPVIMFSTLTERGANTTFDALAAGASDYVLKPSTSSGETLDSVVNNYLVPKLIALTLSRATATGNLQRFVEAPAERSGDDRTLNTRGVFTNRPTVPANAFAAPPITASFGLKNLVKPALSLNAPATTPVLTPTATGSALRDSVAAAARAVALPGAGSTALSRLRASTQALGRKSVQVIAIAASTGGPNALNDVLARLPKNLPVPIVIVQHMPPIFTRCLADRLEQRCELSVVESAGGEYVRAGTVYIAPGNRHLELTRDAEGVHTVLTDGPPENSCRPAADVLFRSVVKMYGAGVLGVVLTGMGQDGARGAREIHEAGGRVIVQSGPTCVIWGMPKAVEEAGIAEEVVPLPDMAQAILQRVSATLFLVSPGEGAR